MPRSAALFVAVMLFLLVAYYPARDSFRSTGDVAIYQTYARGVLTEPVALPQEYPPLTVAIFVVPQLVLPHQYLLGFTLLAALATWLVVLIVDRVNHRGWQLLLYLALGAWGTLFFRYDIFVVLLTLLAFVAATGQRWVVAQVLLALGVALKIYPLMLMPLVVLWQWRATCRFPWRSVLASLMLLLAAFVTMWLISPAQFAGMLHYHAERPLEFESVGASVAWLLGPVTFESSFGSENVTSSLSAIIIRLLTSANVFLLLLVYGCFLRSQRSPAAAWMLTLVFAITTSKVFSTQYVLWPLPFVVLATSASKGAIRWQWSKVYIWLWALICLLTSLIFPVGLTLIPRESLMGLVTLRNVLWLLACGLGLYLWVVPAGQVQMQQTDEAL